MANCIHTYSCLTINVRAVVLIHAVFITAEVNYYIFPSHLHIFHSATIVSTLVVYLNISFVCVHFVNDNIISSESYNFFTFFQIVNTDSYQKASAKIISELSRCLTSTVITLWRCNRLDLSVPTKISHLVCLFQIRRD